ncbi:MAG: hypothetical protein QM645_07885 [Asticcacaulis sp.]
MWRICLAIGTIGIASACSAQKDEPPLPPEAAAISVAASSAATVGSDFVGRWNGPEGTYAEITALGRGYEVSLQNLDGLRSFKGSVEGDGIRIERDGEALLVVHGSGMDTGMKWLMDKRDCIVVKTGEGYCRD